MPATRVMNGVANQTGAKVNTLRIGQMTIRNPRPRYRTICEQCGTESTASHMQIISGAARCLSSTCGKPSQKRDSLTEQRRLVAELEAERLRAEREASSRRMEADTEGYERPERYAPTPEKHRIMSERERLSVREFKEQEEAAERERQRPVREKAERDKQRVEELLAKQEITLRQLHELEREQVANGKDDVFQIDPETIGKPVPIPELEAWHAAQVTQFIADNPDYLACDENKKVIFAYLDRNAPNLKLLSARQLTAVYRRLKEFGLLKQRPAPAPSPTSQPVNSDFTPETREHAALQVEVWEGWDIVTGEPRVYSKREIDRMSSEEFKRAMRLTSASGSLRLPNVGPGPGGPT